MSAIVTFYRPLAIPATIFSAFTCYLLLAWQSSHYILTLFWFKAFSTLLIGAVFHFTRANQLYFYHNLGYSTLRLYLFAAALDFAVWITVIMIGAQFL